jgi:hypothetical protein
MMNMLIELVELFTALFTTGIIVMAAIAVMATTVEALDQYLSRRRRPTV